MIVWLIFTPLTLTQKGRLTRYIPYTHTLYCLCKLIILFFFDPFLQSISHVRAETEIKLGGLQCNIIMSRLKPWMVLHTSKKKKMVLKEETSVVKPKSTDSKTTITWTCKFSTPQMTITLYNMAGFPVYHVSICKYYFIIVL